jgi:UDP-GlcNAc:undecaprenyl-phosphate GlcNAc-1-phosphate transferase
MTTPIVIRVARWMGIVDSPDMRKVHLKPIPRIGGVAIFVSMIGLLVPVLLLPDVVGHTSRLVQTKIIILLGAAGFMFLIGLADDIKGLRARTKLFAQVAAALFVCAAGIRITLLPITGSLALKLGWFSWPFTLIWIVGITNAINLIDGLDGLAAGISAVACGVIAILGIHSGNAVMTVLMLALLGSLTGFLLFNFEPAKIFMGDSGSMFLGSTIASSSVLCAAKTETIVGLALPVLSPGIPIFDTLFSMLRRFLERRSMFSADRRHFHHRLLTIGLRQRQAVITAYAVTLISVGLGMFMLLGQNAQVTVIFVCILLLLVLTFRVAGSIQFQEIIHGVRRQRSLNYSKKRETESFEQAELYFRRAEDFDKWWQAVCVAAKKLEFTSGLLIITNRDGTERKLTWNNNGQKIEGRNLIKTVLPILDRRKTGPLYLTVQVRPNGSLESAGRRMTLFIRLIRGIQRSKPKRKNQRTTAADPSFTFREVRARQRLVIPRNRHQQNRRKRT